MKDKLIYIYYLVLVVLMMTWTSVDTAPPMPVRLVYMALVVLPGLYNNKAWLVAALTCFWSISVNGYAYSYMPTMNYLYALLALVCLFFHKRPQSVFRSSDYIFLVGFLLYFTIENFITSVEVYDISYAFFVLCLFPVMMDEVDDDAVVLFETVFMVITIVLSFYSLTTQNLFAGRYGTFDGVERSGWADPNYLAMIVGMGSLVGFSKILKWGENNRLLNIISIAAFLIALPAMLLIASRGAFVCLIGGIAVLIMSSGTKTIYKLLLVAISIGFLIYLYNNSYFDLMEARMEADDGTGSNRSLIWAHKIQYYGEGNVLNYLFGYGFFDGIRAGSSSAGGFHNDYIAFLVCYGAVGLILFLRWLFLPLARLNKQSSSRFMVYACFVYLAFASLTLEPISGGNFPFLAFWFYMIILSKRSNYEEA